jgi:hypothetical protein
VPELELKYPTITEPTQDIRSIQQSIGQIKEIVEMLTGQRGPTEYSLQEGLSKIERVSEVFGASIRDLTEIAADANGAFAERVSIIEAEMLDARGGEPSVAARITTVDNARVTGDSANASSISTLSAEVTTARGGQASLSAKITDVAAVAASANSATASTVSSLSTTVGTNTANISTVTSSLNGIKVEKVVKATLNGSTGGYQLTGVQNVDGTGAIFTFEINANAVINGNLTVDGTIITSKVATNGVTRMASSATNATYFDDVVISLRAGASVAVFGFIKGDDTFLPFLNGDGFIRLQVLAPGSGGLVDIQNARQAISNYWSGSVNNILLQTCSIMDRYIAPSTGSYTFRVKGGDTRGPGAAIVVLETVR